MQRLGIVGLPNAGKSTLFNTLCDGDSPVAPFPFSTTSTHLGEAKVADERLDLLSALSGSATSTPAIVQFTDIRGLAPGSGGDDGMGGSFLGGVREADALVLVLRAFDDPAVEGVADPLEGLLALEMELSLADSESLERQLAKRRRRAKGEAVPADELERMERALGVLDGGTPIWRSSLTREDRCMLGKCFLLTNKPVVVVVNTDADDPSCGDYSELGAPGAVLGVCAKLEAELMGLPEGERTEFAAELGLGKGALRRLVGAAYDLLGLQTFFTTGPKETRAWPFQAGATAVECAGLIHTDFQRGFIRADCVSWQALLAEGSETAARRNGKIRSEGRTYSVKDGDVMEIRFNV